MSARLLVSHKYFTHKRRIAENVAALFRRQDRFPIEPERIADNVRRFLERQAR